MPPKTWKRPDVSLIGKDGNAFAILGLCLAAAKKKGNSIADIAIFKSEVQSGDYDALLRTCMEWFNVS